MVTDDLLGSNLLAGCGGRGADYTCNVKMVQAAARGGGGGGGGFQDKLLFTGSHDLCSLLFERAHQKQQLACRYLV